MCLYVNTCVCVCVCVSIQSCIHTHTHTHTHTPGARKRGGWFGRLLLSECEGIVNAMLQNAHNVSKET
jgi:hypothetical protein